MTRLGLNALLLIAISVAAGHPPENQFRCPWFEQSSRWTPITGQPGQGR